MDNQELINGLKDILKEMGYDKANAERFCNDPANRDAMNRLDKHCEYIKSAIEIITPKPDKKYNYLVIEKSLPFESTEAFYVVGYNKCGSHVLFTSTKEEEAVAYVKKNSNKLVRQ